MISHGSDITVLAGEGHDRQREGPAINQLHVPVNEHVVAGQGAQIGKDESWVVKGFLVHGNITVLCRVENEIQREVVYGPGHEVAVQRRQAFRHLARLAKLPDRLPPEHDRLLRADPDPVVLHGAEQLEDGPVRGDQGGRVAREQGRELLLRTGGRRQGVHQLNHEHL